MNLPPNTTRDHTDGPKCPQCGQRGCSCAEETEYDPRTFSERREDAIAEDRLERERAGE